MAEVIRQFLDWIKREAVTALWVFLSPLSGFWWAFGKCYPLFKEQSND